MGAAGANGCRLYLISPPVVADFDKFAADVADALSGGDVACFQLRLKNRDGAPAPDDDILRLADLLLPVARQSGAAFLINDRPDLAKASGADGVHIGQQDAAYREARALLGEAASIGVTCHNSIHLAMIAGEAGADYVAFGAFHPTETKAAPTAADPEILTIWRETTIVPSVAIGGVTAGNCGALVRAGADFIAVSGAVWGHAKGPGAAVAELNAAIAAA